jgi:small membrane protein
MIPIKLVLTLGLSMLLVYTMIQKVAPTLLKIAIFSFILAGIYFVWLPDHATVVANWLGVARGTDLVIYVWILLSFAIGLNLHFKVRSARHDITELTRALAMQSARGPASTRPAAPGGAGRSEPRVDTSDTDRT